MERWEAVVGRTIEPGHRTFEKLLQTASVVLKSDLAPFETEWVLDTLLYKPVELIQTVSERRGDEVWLKPLGDAVKLLAEVVTEWNYVEKYYEDIVNLCLLSYDAELRNHALNCLIAVSKKSEIGAKNVSRHISSLEEGTQCKTPLALLVGAICEHHPSVICDDMNQIWRTYLNMLENNKKTDTVTKAVLEGICGLFKHFGEDLPTAEINNFYDSLSCVYMKKARCRSACFKILESYAALFRERISVDRQTRDQLWQWVGEESEKATLNVYKVMSEHVDRKVLEKIIITEVLPHAQSAHSKVKLTALRILALTKISGLGDLSQYTDAQTLENEFRRDKVAHADADMIAWCIESNQPNSERLLQAAILFYDKLPATKRKTIVANGILKSPRDVQQAAIHYLITQSCAPEASIQIWIDLYETFNADCMAESQVVIRELASHVGLAVDMFLEEREEFEHLPPKLSALLALAARVVPLAAAPLPALGARLLALAARPAAAGLAALRAVLAGGGVRDSGDFYQSLRVESCRDEAMLHESCLTLIQAPDTVEIETTNMLHALQIIFSSDVGPRILCDAIKKLDYLLTHSKVSYQDAFGVICLVKKLRSSGDRTDKHIRILHREVLMFLGKHGNTDVNNNTTTLDQDLKKTLVLSLPHQGVTLRVNLQSMLALSLHHEDPETLNVFMTMLCANLSSNNEQAGQLALTRVMQALAKLHAAGGSPLAAAIQRAARLCGARCVAHILQFISTTKSCGVRKLLATTLAPLAEDPETLQLLVERGGVMLSSSDSITKRAGLDVAETIISCLENNNSLCKTILPDILVLIAKTHESDTKTVFDLATKMFIDKKGLFEKEVIKKTVQSLTRNLVETGIDDVKMYKTTVRMTSEFVKALRDVKAHELVDTIFECQNDVDVKVVFVLTNLKSDFNFDVDISRIILGKENAAALNYVLKCGFDGTELSCFRLEAILKFFEEYCQLVLELKYKETIQFLAEIITKLSPRVVKDMRRNLKSCFSTLKEHWKETPRLLLNSFQTWTEMLPLKKITEGLERQYFQPKHELCVNALKIMSKIFDTKDLVLSDVKFDISKWPKLLLKIFCSGRLEEYFFNEMSYFNDILTVSLKFLTIVDVKKLMLEGSGISFSTKDVGVRFCGLFIQGFSEVLTEEPYFLLDEDMETCSVILNDLAKYYVKKTYVKEECERLSKLVDELWPSYDKHTTFGQKHSLLANLGCLDALGPGSRAVQWALGTLGSPGASVEERTKLIPFIPEEALSNPQVLSSVTALFPARAAELRPALLEALASRPCVLYVEIIAALVANDTSSGWWDEALDSCLSAIGQHGREDICRALYDKNRGARVCSRVLVPLLRYSTGTLCEKFLASILQKIFENLNKRPTEVKANHHYQKTLENYMISFSLLLVAFEKLPTSSLEASSSPLYRGAPAPTPWHAVREALKRCEAIRRCDAVACPADAPPALKDTYRQFQCLLYNCYCAAICRRRPSEKVYKQVFGAAAWSKIIDEDRTYRLPITPSWIKRNKSLPVSVPVESPSLLTSRSRIFLRTLSENPMLFDLHTQEEDATDIQDILLPETDLNSHQCAATLTALLRHIAPLPFALWPELASSLKHGHANLKLLLAQIICNCKEELKPHASTLLPGLLAAVATTVDVNGNKCLNGLHLDVLDTIIYWKEDSTSEYFNKIIHYLIITCMEHRSRNTFDSLLKTLYGLLDLYGSSIQIEWESFASFYEDPSQDTYQKLFLIVKTVSKAKLYIPRSLDKILSKLETNPSKVAECFGLAMAACHDDREKREALSIYKKALQKMNVTNFVKVLYYASMGSPECCGEQEFRKAVNYVSKVTWSDRSKCLHVMSVYVSHSRPSAHVTDMFDSVDLSEMIGLDPTAMLVVKNGMHLMSEQLRRRAVLLVADSCQNSSVKIRKAAVDVMLTAFEEHFSKPSLQPPAKRQKVDSTPILSLHQDDVYGNTVLACLGVGASDAADIAGAVRERVGAMLSKDLGVRFAECFLIAVYLPALRNKVQDLSVCLSAMLEMLFSDMRSADNFKNIKFREEPIALSLAPVPAKLLTLSKAFQGTFSSYSTSKARQTNRQEDSDKPSIDVQMPIDNILATLLDFAKSTPDAARSLVTETLHSVISASRFDLGPRLLPLLGSLLSRDPTEATPLCVDVCRVLVGYGGEVRSLLAPAERLKELTAGTEGASLTTLLYEEVRMRCHGDEIYKLGVRQDVQDVAMDDTSTFTLEDLKSSFGRLSDWDSLTFQQRRAVANSSLPPLWTGRRDIVAALDSYEVPTDVQSWFDKMVSSYKQEMGHHSVGWLRAADRWPRRHFQISAITEATSWRHDPSELTDVRNNVFSKGECVAEWAARLMLRSAYYNSLQHSQSEEDRVNKLSRSHELQWCVRANEMGIPRAVLDCVKRNVVDLCESETLPWLRQKLIAMRTIGLEQNSARTLQELLAKADEYNTLEYAKNPAVSIEMYHLMLLLHDDLKSLSYQNLQSILLKVNNTSRDVDWNTSSKAAISSIFEVAMTHYDDSWETDTGTSRDRVLSDMTDAFCQAVELNATKVDMLLAVILNRIDEFTGKIEAGCSQKLLEKLSHLTPTLDHFTQELLKKNAAKFPSHVLKIYPIVTPRDNNMEIYKQCLQIVCDSHHLLFSYCEELVRALRNKDAHHWNVVFDRIKKKIYENQYTGPSYRLLDKYKDELYEMCDFEPTPEFLHTSEARLLAVLGSLRRDPQRSLRLSDLCPALLASQESGGLHQLLGLRGVRVVKFYDQVQVFTDSIRRPVVLSMLLSNGRAWRALHKAGESLAGDAASRRAEDAAARVCGAAGRGYSVTLLSDDSAIIEFLEDHKRLRELIESAHNIDVLNTVMRPADEDLIESPLAASLQRHRELCAKVPAHALRSAMEQSSASVQDFISKKQKFTESLSFMTIMIWMLGLGDRHLQNIMVSADGAACGVDRGDAWRHGAAELPARLTRNLLAAADAQVLESRLQTILAALRASSRLVEAVIKVSFAWMGDRFQDKFKYIQQILHGTTLSYNIYREVMSQSESLKHKEKHIELLDYVFRDVEKKDIYSIEDQVSCLLLHCTSPELLSVTRSGWEPWI